MAASFDVTMRITESFFDRQAVATPAEKARKRNLSKAGAFIRRRARSSIRRRKKVSTAGQPPSAHSKDPTATIKNILFGYDASRDSVVVGPVRLNQVDYSARGFLVRGAVPETLEFGGTLGILETQLRTGKWVRADRRRSLRLNAGGKRRVRNVKIAPRPFMGPALAAEAPNFAGLWEGSVKAD